MAKKRKRLDEERDYPIGDAMASLIPNVTLSRTARTGGKTEDEKLLERPKLAQPVARVPAQAEFTHGDPWRVLRIMGEYVHGFDALAEVGAAVAVFGSARIAPGTPYYEDAKTVGRMLAESGFAVITGGGPGIMEAANRGAREAGGLSVGCNIELPFEQADLDLWHLSDSVPDTCRYLLEAYQNETWKAPGQAGGSGSSPAGYP